MTICLSSIPTSPESLDAQSLDAQSLDTQSLRPESLSLRASGLGWCQ